ncbi:thiol-specific monooxygenase [Cadophora sp. MPI-SDFR-AT-0126]|nr:thiol-specific monooxygenase [Leotiomycetes sp. MPI-SDFR-AT-0126]
MSGRSTFQLPSPSKGDSEFFLSGAELSASVISTAHKFDDLITYKTTLEHVEKENSGKLTLFLRRENDDGTDTWYTEEYDHLVVATGHNTVPRVPDIKGLDSWTGELGHTSTWRSGTEFTDKKILIVGTSESAIDVALQSLPHAKQPVYVSQQSPHPRYPTVFLRDGIKVVSTIESVSGSSITLSDGEKLDDIDVIVFATGYFYTYPFLTEKIRPKSDGYRVPGLYQHVFDMHNPQSIAFVGVVNASLCWETWEKAAFLVALFWTGKIALPPLEDQRVWEVKRAEGRESRAFHVLHPHSERVLHWTELNSLSTEYLESELNVDDELLRDYAFEWTVSLAAAGVEKSKFYGIAR